MSLLLCSRCERHFKTYETNCPFCGELAEARELLVKRVTWRRASRGAMIAGASVVVTLSSCSAYGAPICLESISLTSKCGFTSITTDCANATATCDCCDTTRCSVGPLDTTESCTIHATLGDGTKHDIAVTVGQRAGCHTPVVLTPTSFTPLTFDSGTCVADGGP